jgi:hypothetical protein
VNIGEGSFNSVFNVIQKQIAETVLVFNDFKILKWTRCTVNSFSCAGSIVCKKKAPDDGVVKSAETHTA